MVLNITQSDAVRILLANGPLTKDEVRILPDEKRCEYLLSLIAFVEKHGLEELERQKKRPKAG
jgi:hypothetical protein